MKRLLLCGAAVMLIFPAQADAHANSEAKKLRRTQLSRPALG